MNGKGDRVMREILFRGQRVDNEQWIEGSLIVVSEDYGYLLYYILTQDNVQRIVFSNTVGQYTGLKDKNGVKIFEGDILDCGDRVVRVTWHKNCGTWDSEFIKYKGERNSSGIEAKDWCFRAEVIGNIHDNHELLEVE